MIISSRYTKIILIFFAVAFIPTLMNSYLPADFSLGNRLISFIPEKFGSFHGYNELRHSAPWVKKHFHTEDWIQRRYINDEDGHQVKLFAARSFNARPLFYYPEKILLGRNWTKRTVRHKTLSTAYGTIPTQMINLNGFSENRKVIYALFYGTRPVGNPYTFYLSILPELLLGHREPMTLVFVDAEVAEEEEISFSARTTHLILRAACEAFLSREVKR